MASALAALRSAWVFLPFMLHGMPHGLMRHGSASARSRLRLASRSFMRSRNAGSAHCSLVYELLVTAIVVLPSQQVSLQRGIAGTLGVSAQPGRLHDAVDLVDRCVSWGFS